MSDGYWDRVWILQEIGKARRIQLCLGAQPVEWDAFIVWIRRHPGGGGGGGVGVEDNNNGKDNDNHVGPLKLDHLRRDKYDGSCSLRRLLVNHAGALSKDPRDKIYGLVGLSTDGRGFPMDYGKSLLEVWSDTIGFMSRHDLLPQDCGERVQFCRLVRDLLGGEAALGSVSGVVRLFFDRPGGHESLLDDRGGTGDGNAKHSDDDDETALSLSAVTFWADVYGVIVSLGPTTTELLSSLETTDAWDEELQRLYRGNLDSAHYENDQLLRRVLDAPDGKLVRMSRFRTREVPFHGPEMYRHYWSFMHKHRDVAPGLEPAWVHELRPTRTTTTDDDDDDDEEPRLAMLKMAWSSSGEPSAGWDATPVKLAFVSPDARQGDMVCRIEDHVMKRVVVRPAEAAHSNNVRMHVCGTAVMVRDVLSPTGFDQGPLQASHKLPVAMDARTLYALIFGN
ncbi:hypothetical protein E4U41_002893 [Claviceps citrina]|nr:hypothetical protein E4U41_002893 [Claviceps citrina]